MKKIKLNLFRQHMCRYALDMSIYTVSLFPINIHLFTPTEIEFVCGSIKAEFIISVGS